MADTSPHFLPVEGRDFIASEDGRCWMSLAYLLHEAQWAMHTYRGYRLGQATYTFLWTNGQEGTPSIWPELFYTEKGWSEILALLDSRFDVIDGFLLPK